MREGAAVEGMSVIELDHEYYGRRRLWCDRQPPLLFTKNETNTSDRVCVRHRSRDNWCAVGLVSSRMVGPLATPAQASRSGQE